MAIAKKAVKKAAAAKGSTAIVKWDEEFASAAKDAVEKEKSIGAGGLGIKFGAGTITVAGGTLPGGKMECVILGTCFEHAWYGGRPYDPDDPQPPECYALGEVEDELAPHNDALDKQSETCAVCEKNAFGSADTGRGKACANKKRLAIIVASDLEDAGTAEIAIAKVSPTNLKAWAGYVRAIAEDPGRPPWGVITEISSHPDPKTQIRLEFRLVDSINDNEILTALKKRVGKIQDVLQQPYGPPIERPKKAARVPAGRTQKFAGKGKK